MTTESRTHECEPWEMLEPDEDEPLYCAACGKSAPPTTIEDEDTMTTETTHPIEAGALCRTTRDTTEEESGRARPKGYEFTVEDYVNEKDSEDGIPFYWGSSVGTGNMNDVVVRADAVELVKSSTEMAARTLPSAKEIAEYLASEALGFGNDKFSFDEGDYGAGDGTLELYGRTAEGLPMGVTVKVIRIVQVDD